MTPHQCLEAQRKGEGRCSARGESFLNESIENKHNLLWRCLDTPGMGEWMDGGEEGEPWFADSSARPAFHNNQNKQPLTGVRSAELLQPPRLCFADFLLSLCPCKHRHHPLSWLCSQSPGHVSVSLSFHYLLIASQTHCPPLSMDLPQAPALLLVPISSVGQFVTTFPVLPQSQDDDGIRTFLPAVIFHLFADCLSKHISFVWWLQQDRLYPWTLWTLALTPLVRHCFS